LKWKMRTIATVSNGIRKTPDDWEKVTSKLVIRNAYIDGLYKLSHFKHIWIIFGFHKNKETRMKIHPMHDPARPLVGVFASCSPTRPNKIGLTLVELVSIRKNIVTVRGLDAFDGSPVFDIKPYDKEIDY
jgi:tRNA-Thr(GGU) m(6)t(6)A37 methyltransferase TsaA